MLWAVTLAVGVGCSGRAPAVRSAPGVPADAGSAQTLPDEQGDRAWATIVASDAMSPGDGGLAAPAVTAPAEPAVVGSIAMGEWHACAVMSDGDVRCWGRNREGQLGRAAGPMAPFSARPTSVPGVPAGSIQVSTGTFHTCVRSEDQRIFCWGDNRTRQSGVELVPTLDRPTELRALTETAEITTGRDQTCARHRDGTLRCWGNNENGQLGDGSVRAPFAPVLVAGLRGVAEIAAGSGHTCARLEDGTVRCWGLNASGQLGDGTTTGVASPVSVIGL